MTRGSDSGYRILAARSLRKQVKQFAEHLLGVRRSEDIESIHRARVASRRLRAALGMFRYCWKRKSVKQWKKQIRQLARNLGEARDQDVLIEFLTAKLAGVSDRALVPGIACLLNRIERQRQWIQPRVLKAVDRFEKSGVLRSMQSATGSILKGVADAEPVASECAEEQVAKSVHKRFKELLEESPGIAAPEQHEQHHAMRIAAKRLRYTLELARPVYLGNLPGGNLTETLEAVKKLQTLLGEIHDCDVWVETFAEFAREESGEMQLQFGSGQRFARLQSGLDYLCQERTDRRHQVFGELVTYWQELKDQGVWDRLATLLERGGVQMKSAESQ